MKRVNNNNIFITISLLALLYFFAGEASFILLNGIKIVNLGVFAPEGISLAFALFFGKRVWPGVFLGQFLLAYVNDIDLISSFGIAAINSMEVIIATTIFRVYKLNINLSTFRDVIGFVLMVVFILQPFSAFFSNFILLLNSQIASDKFLYYIFSWWFGNVMGQLLFTPFLLFAFLNYKKIDLLNLILYGVVFAILIYLLEIVFVIKNILVLLSLTLPVVIFVISKKGVVYGTLFNIIIAIVSSYSVYIGIGVFYLNSDIDNIINYNLFVLIYIATSLVSGVLFEQRKRLESDLRIKMEEAVKKNQDQQILMIQQSRLAQMGEMIAMIAHQWRQPLNNLSLANQLLISKYKKGRLDDEAVEYFKINSKKQIDLMSSTIDDFRTFFKSEKIKYRFCINNVVEKILDMVIAIFTTKGIEMDFVAEGKYYGFGYPNDLGQAVLNIINNAKDALIESDIDKKKITINLKKVDNQVILSVCDNAGGIPEDIIDKIFDPYFSTKSNKNGTGLGLYMTKMIVEEKLGAKIEATNEKDGACFRIFMKEDREGDFK